MMHHNIGTDACHPYDMSRNINVVLHKEMQVQTDEVPSPPPPPQPTTVVGVAPPRSDASTQHECVMVDAPSQLNSEHVHPATMEFHGEDEATNNNNTNNNAINANAGVDVCWWRGNATPREMVVQTEAIARPRSLTRPITTNTTNNNNNNTNNNTHKTNNNNMSCAASSSLGIHTHALEQPYNCTTLRADKTTETVEVKDQHTSTWSTSPTRVRVRATAWPPPRHPSAERCSIMTPPPSVHVEHGVRRSVSPESPAPRPTTTTTTTTRATTSTCASHPYNNGTVPADATPPRPSTAPPPPSNTHAHVRTPMEAVWVSVPPPTKAELEQQLRRSPSASHRRTSSRGSSPHKPDVMHVDVQAHTTATPPPAPSSSTTITISTNANQDDGNDVDVDDPLHPPSRKTPTRVAFTATTTTTTPNNNNNNNITADARREVSEADDTVSSTTAALSPRSEPSSPHISSSARATSTSMVGVSASTTDVRAEMPTTAAEDVVAEDGVSASTAAMKEMKAELEQLRERCARLEQQQQQQKQCASPSSHASSSPLGLPKPDYFPATHVKVHPTKDDVDDDEVSTSSTATSRSTNSDAAHTASTDDLLCHNARPPAHEEAVPGSTLKRLLEAVQRARERARSAAASAASNNDHNNVYAEDDGTPHS